MRRLETLTIRNFKSIRAQTLSLGSLNVFIGANGSGKSNLIEVFRFLQAIVRQNLADYTLRNGGANALLYLGCGFSGSIRFELDFVEGSTPSNYAVSLISPNDFDLVIGMETATSNAGQRLMVLADGARPPRLIARQSPESKLRESDDLCDRQMAGDLEGNGIYHFHDTSTHAEVKGPADLKDNRYLRPQAENLAAFLYWMQQTHPAHFANIRDTVRQVALFFGDFQLRPSGLNKEEIRLEWKEAGSDACFNASSLSDGTLRFICLATLLLQPDPPRLVLLDEPELSLHPAAITVLAALLTSAATRTQLIVATQSVTLVNQFEPGDIWTADRTEHETAFRHLNDEDMIGWLDDYALGELWEKNVLGARP